MYYKRAQLQIAQIRLIVKEKSKIAVSWGGDIDESEFRQI